MLPSDLTPAVERWRAAVVLPVIFVLFSAYLSLAMLWDISAASLLGLVSQLESSPWPSGPFQAFQEIGFLSFSGLLLLPF